MPTYHEIMTTDLSALAAAAERSVAVISDLHMGIGKNCDGSQCTWDHYEDFRWATDFDAFLDASLSGQGII